MSKGLFVSLFGHAAIVGMMGYSGLAADSESTANIPHFDGIGDLIRTIENNNIDDPAKRLVIGNETRMLVGAFDFCARRPDFCTYGLEGEFLQTGKIFSESELAKINSHINDTYIPSFDEDMFGEADFWYIPGADGEPDAGGGADCEDYALSKRKMLIDAGWPVEDLFIAVMFQRYDEQQAHAILLARLPGTQQYYGLDNLHGDLLSLSEINQMYDMLQINVGPVNSWREARLEYSPTV